MTQKWNPLYSNSWLPVVKDFYETIKTFNARIRSSGLRTLCVFRDVWSFIYYRRSSSVL